MLITTLNMTQLNEKQNTIHGLAKTTIELPALNNTLSNVLTDCTDTSLSKSTSTTTSLKQSLNDDLLAKKLNNGSSPQMIIHRKSTSSVTSSLDDASANSLSHISSNGSIKSNGAEARSSSVGNRTAHLASSSYVSSSNIPLRNIMNTTPLTTKQPHIKSSNKGNSTLLVRRHSTYQDSANKINNDFSDVILNSSKKRNGNFFI